MWLLGDLDEFNLESGVPTGDDVAAEPVERERGRLAQGLTLSLTAATTILDDLLYRLQHRLLSQQLVRSLARPSARGPYSARAVVSNGAGPSDCLPALKTRCSFVVMVSK